jgi:hypothetical protein
MLKSIAYLLPLLFLITAGLSFGQQPPDRDAELKDLLHRAGIRMSEYVTRFKDLTAEEQQTVEEYDDKGKLKRPRLIVSDLFIYQSQVDPTQMVEYRDVKSVDGVPIKKREARLLNLLAKSAKASSVKKELERVNRESTRYDRGFTFYGMTLYQGFLLDESLRESFEFKVAGREQVNGHDTILVEYLQVSQTPKLAYNLSLPAPLKGAQPLYRGRVWLDAETAQLRREVREFALRLPSLARVLVMTRFELEYVDSRFGFLTPQRIVITNYSRGRTGADKQPEVLLGGRVTFAYGAFIRFSVEAPDASLTLPSKP